MKVAILIVMLATLCAVVWGSSSKNLLRREWNEYKLKHNKWYDTLSDEEYRFNVYLENRMMIAKHNQRFDMGLETYDMAVNHFADLTNEEFLQQYTGAAVQNETFNFYNSDDVSEKIMPADYAGSWTFDWRQHVKTRVKEQGKCLSFWAFSALTTLEYHLQIHKRIIIELSEQQLVDCFHSGGCQSPRNAYKAFNYIQINGIAKESTYPYIGRDQKCKYNPKMKAASTRGYKMVKGISDMEQSVRKQGPLVVNLYASDKFKLYKSGIFNDPNCPKKNEHNVVIVGFGNDVGKNYWIIQNSWGTKWGEKGYMKISKGNDNMCGINMFSAYPLV